MAMDTAFRSDGRFTQAEFVEWLDEYESCVFGRCELIDGEIVMTPPAKVMHGRTASRLHFAIYAHVSKHRLGEVFESSVGYEFESGDTLEPDVSFLSTARSRSARPFLPSEFHRGVPDLVVEVLSPSTSRRDRTEKKRIYAINGVDEYWIADPARRQLTVFRREDTSYGDGVAFDAGPIRSHVLPQLELTVEALFAEAN